MKVRYRELALADLEQIFQYLSSRSPHGANLVLHAIHAAIAEITEFPLGAEQTSSPGIRVKVIGRYRYKIFFSLYSDAIEIVHVRHTARRPIE